MGSEDEIELERSGEIEAEREEALVCRHRTIQIPTGQSKLTTLQSFPGKLGKATKE